MGAEIVTIAAAESDTPEKHLSAPLTRLSGVFLSSICALFCRRGINTVEYAGAESRWFLCSVLELLNIPHAKLIMDCVIYFP